MLIPEAVQLVLQAATIGKQGHVYILDMGEQIKVLDLARSLIRLSGFIPGKEIAIQFIGLRPGEKLYEELVGEGEIAVRSSLEKILQIQTTSQLDFEEFRERLSVLEAASYCDETSVLLERLREIVPMFRACVSDTEASTEPVAVDRIIR